MRWTILFRVQDREGRKMDYGVGVTLSGASREH